MKFFLGTHKAHWLRLTNVPLFVSRRTLSPVKDLPRAVGSWALDSGGFTELSMHGRWTLSPRDYVKEIRRFRDEIGNLAWAAPQDWMCEPHMIARTGLSLDAHQLLTVQNFVELKSIAPDLPFVPVVQGWSIASYWRCLELYEVAGVRLAKEPIVGVGTVCRRQAMTQAGVILATLRSEGVKIHGFGFKIDGIKLSSSELFSSDSMAWSLHARKRPPIDGHTHKSCANCLDYAMQWRGKLLAECGLSDER